MTTRSETASCRIPKPDGPGPSERYLDLHRYWSDVTVVVFANQSRHSLRLEKGQHIGKFVVDRKRGELLRIAQERSETQEIVPLNLLKEAFVAGLLEITEGDVISPPCLSLPGELDFHKEIVYSRPNSKAGVVLDWIGNNETCRDCVEFSLLSNVAFVCRSRVGPTEMRLRFPSWFQSR